MIGRNIIVIGASAGGVQALSRLVGDLPGDLNAAVLVVMHIGPVNSRLPEILGRVSKLPVAQAVDHEPIRAGHVYIAPPDLHMIVEAGEIRLVRGPKENFTRPAIDPLFRSAAIAFGKRVVGVVLTGHLDDGSAGLMAIKDRGGVAIVQDPDEAYAQGMPSSAIKCVAVDHVTPLAGIAPLLVGYDPPEMKVAPVTRLMKIEHKVTAMQACLTEEKDLERLGTPSPLTCPDCHGILYRLRDSRMLRFRCRAGHAMSAQALAAEMTRQRESAVWSAVRACTEEAWLSRQLMPDAIEAERLLKGAEALRATLEAH